KGTSVLALIVDMFSSLYLIKFQPAGPRFGKRLGFFLRWVLLEDLFRCLGGLLRVLLGLVTQRIGRCSAKDQLLGGRIQQIDNHRTDRDGTACCSRHSAPPAP